MKLSKAAEKRIEEIMALYPNARSAIMPALYIAQEELGHITPEAIEWVAERINVAPVHVMEVATFYTMYYKKPVGKYHVQVCRTLSCAVCGSKSLCGYLQERLGVEPHVVTEDGMWSYEQVECLGSCGTGPMAQINDVYFERLTREELGKVMDEIEKEQPDLRYSTVRDELGVGLPGRPRSQVISER